MIPVVRPNARLLPWAVAGTLAVIGGAVIGFLLWRHPYAGLYGQDSYAYFFQARDLWRALPGRPPLPGDPYSAGALYHWPVGYHLQIIAGFLLSGESPAGGRLLTLALTVAAPILLAALTAGLAPGAAGARWGAGALAGLALLAGGGYLRTGLSLMADVPACACGLAGLACAVRAWPPDPGAPAPRSAGRWALGAGLGLGGAILLRFGADLLLVPLAVYLAIRCWDRRRAPRAAELRLLLWAGLGGALALLPQAIYLAEYPAGLQPGGWLDTWSPANWWSTTTNGPDGTQHFQEGGLLFYVQRPLGDAAAGR